MNSMKLAFVFSATILAQMVHGQFLGSNVINQNNIGFGQNLLPNGPITFGSPLSSNSVFETNAFNHGSSPSCGSNVFNAGVNAVNLAQSNLGASGLNLGSTVLETTGINAIPSLPNGLSFPPGCTGGIFNVVSGSPTYSEYPSGVQVFSDNIEVGGQVAVNGAVPFLGSVAVDGSLPIGGQAALSYAAGPTVSLNGGGCGGGLNGLGSVNGPEALFSAQSPIIASSTPILGGAVAGNNVVNNNVPYFGRPNIISKF